MRDARVSTEAQDAPVAVLGERVRVSTESGASHVGRVTGITTGSLQLLGIAGGSPLLVPTDSVVRLEVSRQQSMAFLGFVAGAAAGALLAVAYCNEGEENCVYTHLNGGRNDFNAELPLILGAVGGVGGLLVGRRIRTDHWEPVPLSRLQVGLAPSRDGRLAAGLSLRF